MSPAINETVRVTTPDTKAPTIADFTQDTVAFPWQQRTPLHMLQVLPAMAVALIAGQLSGHPAAGAIAAGAAYTTGFAVFHEALASSLLSLALCTLGIASATLFGSLAAPYTVAVFAVTALAAFNYGLFSGLGPTASWVAQNCAVFAIVNCFFAGGPRVAAGRASMVLLGGAIQMSCYATVYLLRRRGAPPVPLARQMHTRSRQLWRAWREELHWSANTTAYTLRLIVALLAATALYRHDQLHNGYWAPMTALLVLKPQWASTISRGVARTVGTTLAAAIAFGVYRLHHGAFSHTVYFWLILAAAGASVAVQAVNYAAFSFALTLYIVFLFAFGGFSQRSAAEIRMEMTVLGGAIALAVDLLWLGFVRLYPEHPAAQRSAHAVGVGHA